jgi:hypothetical protein
MILNYFITWKFMGGKPPRGTILITQRSQMLFPGGCAKGAKAQPLLKLIKKFEQKRSRL